MNTTVQSIEKSEYVLLGICPTSFKFITGPFDRAKFTEAEATAGNALYSAIGCNYQWVKVR